MTILFVYFAPTATGLQALASTTDAQACAAILNAFRVAHQVVGVCVRIVPGVGA